MDILGLVNASGLDFVFIWAGEILQAEVTKMTIAFMLAARLHRRWVKKDMSEQFSKITEAINNVADRLTLDLSNHSERIDDLRSRMTAVEGKIK